MDGGEEEGVDGSVGRREVMEEGRKEGWREWRKKEGTGRREGGRM